jgi:4'-phosphopantetheinyl transferase
MLTITSTQSESTKKQSKRPEVFWLEQRETDVPEDDLWLGERELAKLTGLRFAKRRMDWRLGRWTAKCALASHLNRARNRETLTEIEILPARDGAPEVRVGGLLGAAAISLSHRNGIALCAIASAGTALGCDLELIEPRSEAFISDYLTDEEQRTVAGLGLPQRFVQANLFWSAKESALKAMRTGLRCDTRSLRVILGDDPKGIQEWHPLQVQSKGGELFTGWWKEEATMLRTLVASPPAALPTALRFERQ